jgi:tetraacyldisaccharide 4'-kinase
LRNHDVDLFILDDGFQHHSLSRDLNILAVDDRRRFGSGRLLPAGLLREPVGRAKDAEFVVVTKADDVDIRFDKWLRELSGAPVLWTNLVAGTPGPITPVENFPEGMVAVGPWLAFCGIADPESYRQTLDREGIDYIDLVVFPDHHPYLEKEASDLMDKARRAGANALLTTEKDAVRWPVIEDALPLHVLPVDLVPVKGEEELLKAILTLVEERGNGR